MSFSKKVILASSKQVRDEVAETPKVSATVLLIK